MKLVILEAVNTTYALILIPVTQKYTDFDVHKNIFSAPSLCHLYFPLFLLLPFFSTSFSFFYSGSTFIHEFSTSTKTLTRNQTKYNTSVLRKSNSMRTQLQIVLNSNVVDQPIMQQKQHAGFFQNLYEDVVMDDGAVR